MGISNDSLNDGYALAGECAARLCGAAGGPVELPLPLPPSVAGLPEERIRETAETRVRYGYCRIHVLLRCEDWRVNGKRVYRLYCEEGLQLRNKTPKRKVPTKLRGDRCSAVAPNEVWAMDFMSDQLFYGRP